MHLLPHLCSETTCGATPSGPWSDFAFALGYQGPVTPTRPRNLLLARSRRSAVPATVALGVSRGHTTGLFRPPAVPALPLLPPLGARERSDGSVHLVLELSSPRGASIKWEEQVYVDLRLPFGARSSPPFYFVRGCSHVLHYLDDYFLVRDSHAACAHDLHAFHDLCRDLGAPLAPEKLVLPTCCLQFLGVTLDSSLQEISLPLDKLARLRDCLPAWWTRQKCTNRVHCC